MVIKTTTDVAPEHWNSLHNLKLYVHLIYNILCIACGTLRCCHDSVHLIYSMLCSFETSIFLTCRLSSLISNTCCCSCFSAQQRSETSVKRKVGNEVNKLMFSCLFFLLFNGTSALFTLLVPRTVGMKLMKHVKNDLWLTS